MERDIINAIEMIWSKNKRPGVDSISKCKENIFAANIAVQDIKEE